MGKWPTFRTRFCSLLMDSDMTPARFFLAFVAGFWAIALWLPGDTFERPVYVFLAAVAGETWWAITWSVYSIALFWRVFSSARRPRIALILNAFGLLLFATNAGALIAARVWPFPAAVSADICCAFLAFWVTIRTNSRSEHGWRDD